MSSSPRLPLSPSLPLLPLSASLTRRRFVVGSAALTAAAFLSSRARAADSSGPKLSSYPFTLGVASGEPTPTAIVLWTRLAPRPLEPGGGMPTAPAIVWWEVADDDKFTRIVRSGTTVANPHQAHSVHAEVEGLRPDRWYFYRFRSGGAVSPTGRTRTLPPPAATPDRLRFAFVSCQHYEAGLYTAFDHLAREDLDLIVHLGDYIYEGAARDGQVRRHNSGEIFTLDDYRARYALYRSDPALQAAHAMAPWIVTWDDHEVTNNYANTHPGSKKQAHDDFMRRRAAAYQAYFEVMPLRRTAAPTGPDMTLYRRLGFGRLAQFHVLDTRQYRTPQPQGDGNKPPSPVLMDPKATLLGDKQREWLFNGLERSPTDWNILAQQIMMARVDKTRGPDITYSMDQWPGYEFERRRVLRHFHDKKIKNPVVLTGDIHTNWANELIADFDELGGRSVATEFVGTSISSGGDGAATPKTTDELYAENPCVKFFNAERGYVRCEVTSQTWRTDFRTVPYVSKPGAPINTRATFVVESGTPKLTRV